MATELQPGDAADNAEPMPAGANSPAAADGHGDALDQIKRLGDLRDAGLVTPDEFEAKKAELLGRL